MSTYRELFGGSQADPEGFWRRAAGAIDWFQEPATILDRSNALFDRWFADGTTNICFNALDRHIQAGHGDRVALQYDSPVTRVQRSISYAQLLNDVARFAGALTRLGVTKGERVVIYMPMVPEAVVAMLACARIGAVHSVVFGGFAPSELAHRIDDASPKVVVSASCGIEGRRVVEYKPLLDRAIDLAAHQPHACIILQRPDHATATMTRRDIDWHDALADATAVGYQSVAGPDPLYILYTSGTTGKPKGVVHDHGGYAVGLQWAMTNVYDVGPGDTIFTASDVGWAVGHSCIAYGPLIAGATAVLYEGKPVGTPDPGQFWRVVADHGVKTLLTAPTAIRAIRKDDPHAEFLRRYDTASLECLFLAGERLDPDTLRWAQDLLGIPVIDHWWQTETGWPVVANPMGLEPQQVKVGSPGVPMPGWNVRALEPDGAPAEAGAEGSLVLKLPLPPGALTTLWNDDQRYVAGYLSDHEGYYVTGDSGFIDSDGYVFVMGRADDVINVAGHRLSTGSIEAVVSGHPAVAECAVVGAADALKGQVPHCFVVFKTGVDVDPRQLSTELNTLVRDTIGPIASLNDVTVVDALPKTRSGKILRKSIRALVDGRVEPVPATIEDPASLVALTLALQARSAVTAR